MNNPSKPGPLPPAPTRPPQTLTELHPFQAYLQSQQLSWLVVAQSAHVRCLTVWNLAHGVRVSHT